MRGSWRIGSIAGIEIDVHPSWLLIFVLLTFSLATGWFPVLVPGLAGWVYWLMGGVAAVLLFASVLAHELAHAQVARRRGIPVNNITLFVFGGVSNIEREPNSPGAEFEMAFVGPLTSLMIGALAWLLTRAVATPAPLLGALLSYLAISNLLLGVFNLLPAFPLDGGRVLRAVLWKLTGNLSTATRVAVVCGGIFAFAFIVIGFWLTVKGDILDGLWLALIGWFLLQAGHAESAQITRARVRHEIG